MKFDSFSHRFSRTEVEQGDFSNFLRAYRVHQLPSGRELSKMMGSLIFMIDGYNDDPRELSEISEVRDFYWALHKAWPYWLYFCDLTHDGLKLMVICCLKSSTSLRIDGQPKCV